MKNFVIIISVCIILLSVGWHYRANIIFEIYPLILEARGYGERSELSVKEIINLVNQGKKISKKEIYDYENYHTYTWGYPERREYEKQN